MKTVIHRTVSLAATAVLLSALSGVATMVASAAGATARAASTTPPWEPDPNSVGGLIFYNASGTVVTGGNLSDTPVATYVEGTVAPRAGDTKATLFGYLPVDGQVPGEWSGEELGGSTAYPNDAAPSPLDELTLPLETGYRGDETIGQLEEDFPNTDTSDDGYADMYQLRLYTSKPEEGISTVYDSADIEVTDSTWSVVYTASSQVTTTTSLGVSKSTSYHGTDVRLTATVTPNDAVGSVQFRSGATIIATKAVASGAVSDVTDSLANGTDHLTAEFIPTTSANFTSSTSAARTLKIEAHPTTTTLKSSTHTASKGQSVALSASETPAVTGTVSFYDGSKLLASVKVSKGAAKHATKKLGVGVNKLRAKFTPANTANDSVSTSSIVKVTIKK